MVARLNLAVYDRAIKKLKPAANGALLAAKDLPSALRLYKVSLV
jgi:hypothetical protein